MVKLKLVYGIRVSYLLIAGIVTFLLFQTVSDSSLVETNYQCCQPWDQYNNKKTSILTEVSEPVEEFYPSVTVCAGHK